MVRPRARLVHLGPGRRTVLPSNVRAHEDPLPGHVRQRWPMGNAYLRATIDSARVRRLAGKLRRARVKIFIVAFRNFSISRNPSTTVLARVHT